MANEHWEPCPRCESRKTEFEDMMDHVGKRRIIPVFLAVLLIGGLISGPVIVGPEPNIGDMLLAPITAWLLLPVVVVSFFVSAFIVLAIGKLEGLEGFHGSCSECKYQWEINDS